jgi:hypothetical protein
VLACLLVLPGTVLRGWPHLSEIAGSSKIATTARVDSPSSGSPAISLDEFWSVPQPSFARRVLGVVVEVGLHVGLLVMVLRSDTLVALFAALPRSGRAATAVFSVVLMTGFLAGHAGTYPFVAWRMYSNQPTRFPVIVVVEGDTRAASTVRIDLNRLMPAMGPRRLSHILRDRARAMTSGDDAESQRRRSHVRRMLAAIAGLYNADDSNDPLVRIRLVLAHAPLDAMQPPWLRDRREILSVDVERRS